MVFPSRSRFKNGASRLSAALEETSGCRKLTDEEKEALCNAVLFEEEKDPDILLDAKSAEPTVQIGGDHQKEVKIEEESDVDGHSESALNAADLLGESDAEGDGNLVEDESNDEDVAAEDADEEVTKKREDFIKTPDNTVTRLLFACPAKNCPVSYAAFKGLEEHMEHHTNEQDFFCDVCKKSFSSKDDALEHIREKEKKECCECRKKFHSFWKLNQHHRCHTGEKPFVCQTCGKRFAQLGYFNSHRFAHTGEEKPFPCGFCEKRFTQKADVKKHERTHTGEKPYSCSFCKKRFSQRTHLKTHEMTHTGEKPHECNHCGRRFTDRSAFNLHIRLHTGLKPYPCKECDKKFMRNDHLKSHMRRIHKL